MNKPIRTLAVVCLLLFVALLLNITYVQYVEAGEPQRTRRQQAGARRGVLPQARRRSSSAASRSPRACQSNDQLQVPARLPAAGRSTPSSPATTPTSTAARRSSRARTRSSPAATRGCSSTGSSTCSATTSPRAAACSLTIDPKAQKAAFDGLRALGNDAQGAVVALEPSHRRDPRDGQPARRTTRTGWPRTTSARCQAPGTRLNADQRPSRCSTARSRRSTRPARRSSWSPRPPRCPAASTPRTPRSTGGTTLDLPQTTDQPGQRERLRLRRRPDHADPGARGLVQRRRSATSASSSAPTRCATQAEKFGFDDDLPRRPARPGHEPVPGRPRRAADRAVRDRPVRRRGHPAADGDGRRRDRQRRRR